MADSFKKLNQLQVPTGVTSVYTAPALTSVIVRHMRAVNTNVSGITLKMWHTGTTDADVILPAVSIDAGGWAEFEGTIILEAGEQLYAQASSATSITLTLYGLEVN